MTFAQRFRLQDRIVVIEWHCPRDGVAVVDTVEGIDVAWLPEPLQREAHRAVCGRIGEVGEHREEPK